MPSETRTLCPYCGVGCGLIAEAADERLTAVRGDPLYPVNRGRTCRKPLELPTAVHAPDRALEPLLRERRDGRFTPSSWDAVLGNLAARLTDIRERHGPDAIGFYISGQLLTEDYYAANKLVKGFLGTNNIDSNSRLCMSSAVAGYSGAFGFDGPPPGYADLDQADCLLLLGSNAAACHPIVWGRIERRRREGAFVICADPRATPTARGSDLHLAVRPGTDLSLLNSLLHVLVRDGLTDASFIRHRTEGFDQAAATAAEWPPERAADVCGVPAQAIEQAAHRFGEAARAMVLWSMGANQSTVGTLKNRALINLCLATGQIGRPGTGPLSLTGQPNAMGGRETGGLAHLLPGYRKVQSGRDRREMEAHWDSPPISPRPGLPAVELFEAAAEGRVKALWIVATNPVVSMPDSRRVRAALERAELVVVQDAYHPTETSALAHFVLPAAAWPEKSGTMTNSERRVGLVRAVLAPPGQALPDWRVFAGLAAALGHERHFAWGDERHLFDEFVACTAARPCDMTGLSHERLRREGGLQWPCPAGEAGEGHPGSPRLYERGRFPTRDGRARFTATPHTGPAEPPSPGRPLLLTTGRFADHWHTLTRTGKSPRLRAASPEPLLELHPSDAAQARVADGQPVRVRSDRGSAVLRVRTDAGMPRGVAFAPMHWGALHAPPGAGTVNQLSHGATDPVSRQPELKAIAVRISPVPPPARPPARRRGLHQPRRLVVVGTGMAGLSVVQEALSRRPRSDWQVTMLGEEPGLVYNRILLSKLLARTCGPAELELQPEAWYRAHGVELAGSRPAVSLDLERCLVTDASGREHSYDRLVVATGSRPFVPPIPGAEQAHVHPFRTRADVDAIAAAVRAGAPAVVLGGGLLGLEAAAGLLARGARVTVVELADRVMPQQLDPPAARHLSRALERLGLSLELGVAAATIEAGALVLGDGRRLAAEIVVVAAGIRPEATLARQAGLEVAHGIVVDDAMRTSAPGVWAVGECAEHRGVVAGLWAPISEQARVAGAGVAGDPAHFHGGSPATTLKVAGVDVFAGGRAQASAGEDEIVFSDTRRGVHRKLVLSGERLVGALLVGDITAARSLSQLLRTGEPGPGQLLASGVPASGSLGEPGPEATICACNAVTRGAIDAAIAAGGLTTVAQVGRVTRATTGCGGCASDVAAVLAAHRSPARNDHGTEASPAPATMAS